MEPTVIIPARLALLMARHLNAQSDVMRKAGHQRATKIFGSWKNELIDAVSEQCTTEEFKAACVAVKLEENR